MVIPERKKLIQIETIIEKIAEGKTEFIAAKT
jgi:hypothetical protein